MKSTSDPSLTSGPIKAEKISLAKLSKSDTLKGASEREQLQRDTLTPIVWFFGASNVIVCLMVTAFAAVEHFSPLPGKPPVITDKVMITVIGGISVQIASVIIAAFRGLFAHK